MVEVKSKSVKLSTLFDSKRGNSKYTKSYVNQHIGDYEVFTGSTKSSFGFIDTYEYDNPHLTYTTDGEYAGTLNILQGKYNIGGHRAVLLPLPQVENLSLAYCKYTFQTLFYNSVKRGDVPSLTWDNIKNKEVNIPINENGEFDLNAQEEIVRKFELIESRKAELADKIEQLKTVEVDVLSGEVGESKLIKVSNLFDLTNSTNSSKFTKTFVKENLGDIPVYGASSDDIPSYGYVKDNAVIFEKESGRETAVKYFEDCLTYNIDGLAGYVFYHEGRFTLSEKVRPLVLQDEYKDCVSPLYLKQILEPIFRANVKGRKGKNGKNEYTKLNTAMIKDLEIPLPINSTGQIDLEKQQKIVENAQTIASMKDFIERQGYQFIQSNLNFNSEGLPYIYIYITVDELFTLKRGMSKYTKKYCLDNVGEYPVYSANNKIPLGYRNDFDYNGRYATISVNGIAGKVTLLENQFSLNADRVILLPKNKNIDIDYISYILEPLLRKKVKGRRGQEGKNEYTKIDRQAILDTKIPIPFNQFGQIDEAIQKRVLEKFSKIAFIKEILSEKVENFLATVYDIEDY